MSDMLKLEKVQDYRFGSLVKGEHYAYARGLTINPTHLPAALDAMEADGWKLMALFGQTDSEHVGFVFKREQGPFSHRDFIALHTENERLRRRVDDLLGANNNEVERRREAERKWQQFKGGVPLGDIK